jgi:hypothetical protein
MPANRAIFHIRIVIFDLSIKERPTLSLASVVRLILLSVGLIGDGEVLLVLRRALNRVRRPLNRMRRPLNRKRRELGPV